MAVNKYTAETRKNIQLEPLHVVILAGGVNFREKKQGVKALTQLGEGTVLDAQLKILRHVYPKAVVTITVGFQAERIIKARPIDVACVENQLWESEGQTEEIRLFFNAFNPSRLLMVDGSVYFNEESVRILTDRSSVLTYISTDAQEVGMRIEEGLVSHLSYGLKDKFGGLLYLEGGVLEKFKKISVRSNSKLFLYESVNLLLDKKVEIASVFSNKAEIIKF